MKGVVAVWEFANNETHFKGFIRKLRPFLEVTRDPKKVKIWKHEPTFHRAVKEINLKEVNRDFYFYVENLDIDINVAWTFEAWDLDRRRSFYGNKKF